MTGAERRAQNAAGERRRRAREIVRVERHVQALRASLRAHVGLEFEERRVILKQTAAFYGIDPLKL